jgi:hypothetical protein
LAHIYGHTSKYYLFGLRKMPSMQHSDCEHFYFSYSWYYEAFYVPFTKLGVGFFNLFLAVCSLDQTDRCFCYPWKMSPYYRVVSLCSILLPYFLFELMGGGFIRRFQWYLVWHTFRGHLQVTFKIELYCTSENIHSMTHAHTVIII